MVNIFRDQKGNIATPLLLVVGGISLVMGHNEMKNVNSRVDQAREESQKNFMAQQNVSSLQMAARLMVGDNPSITAPVHLDPYVQSGACDQGRKLSAGNGGNWQSTADSITVKSLTQQSLQKNGDEIFGRLSQGKPANLAADINTTLRVLGWKCSPTQPFLMEGVYVEAAIQQSESGHKAAKTKALLAMAPPPPSSCLFYGKDSSGNVYPNNKMPSGNPEIKLPLDAIDLYLECNNVVTDANVLKDGVKLAGTNSYPVTAANRIDPAFKRLLGPVAMTVGRHALQAVIEQVDGSKLLLEMVLNLESVAPPAPPPSPSSPPVSSANPEACSYKCVTLLGDNYPGLCESRMIHKDYYQGHSPDLWVCYQCGKYYGFDPSKGCKDKEVGKRDTEGCFADDTNIQLENGKTILVKDLRSGDRIWNPILKKGMSVQNVVAGPESQPLYRIQQGEDILRVTQAHPFLTPLGMVAARDLKPGDLIPGKNESWVPVKSVQIEAEGYGKKVWNFEIVSDLPSEEAHMLIANGIVTGDLYLQKRSISRHLLETISMEQSKRP